MIEIPRDENNLINGEVKIMNTIEQITSLYILLEIQNNIPLTAHYV